MCTEKDETSASALRELEEETGLRGEIHDLIYFRELKRVGENTNEIYYVYSVKCKDFDIKLD